MSNFATRTTDHAGTYVFPFVSEHGYSQPAYTITIDPADLVAGDMADNAFPGYLPAGFPLGLVTASGRYAKYDNTNGDGTETLRGVLKQDVYFAAADGDYVTAEILTHAVMSAAKMPEPIDAAGLADLPTLTVVA